MLNIWYLPDDGILKTYESYYCFYCICYCALVSEKSISCAIADGAALWVCENYEEFFDGKGIFKSV